jgi:integrase
MFNKIHAEALKSKKVWIARSMELALITSQRESDLSAIEFKKSSTSTSWVESDVLCVCQIKSQLKTKIRIPLDLAINNFQLGRVLKSCRSNILTKWAIHQNIRHGAAKPGDRITAAGISRGFAEMRDQAGVGGDNPPSFHEIRSLSIRLQSEKNGDKFAQALAGHKNADMTALYRDVRGSEWGEVKAS